MGVKERVQEISNNKNVKIGMGPVTAKIELTGRCNFDCFRLRSNSCYENKTRIAKEFYRSENRFNAKYQ